MGYRVELVASPPRPIPWADLAQVGRAQGWAVHDAEQELRLERDGVLVTRVEFPDGTAWVKTPDDAALSALIALADRMGLRARGDDWESYRSLTDWYIHPDDKAAHARAALPSPDVQRMRKRERRRALLRIMMLALILAGFAYKVWMDFQ